MATLLDDLNAFYLEHRRCGALDTGIEDGRVWMTYECGAGLTRSYASRGEGAEGTAFVRPMRYSRHRL
jgi:hypothetical protein